MKMKSLIFKSVLLFALSCWANVSATPGVQFYSCAAKQPPTCFQWIDLDPHLSNMFKIGVCHQEIVATVTFELLRGFPKMIMTKLHRGKELIPAELVTNQLPIDVFLESRTNIDLFERTFCLATDKSTYDEQSFVLDQRAWLASGACNTTHCSGSGSGSLGLQAWTLMSSSHDKRAQIEHPVSRSLYTVPEKPYLTPVKTNSISKNPGDSIYDQLFFDSSKRSNLD